jgi:magnesium transporter
MDDTITELSIEDLTRGAWLHLANPSNEELSLVSSATNVPKDFLKAGLDEEERSHTEIEDNCILVVTNIPIIVAENNYDTLPLGIIISTEYIITVCLENNPVLTDFVAAGSATINTAKKTRFLFQILYKSAALYLKYLKQINRRTDEIGTYLHKSMKNQEIFQLLDLQKGLTYFTVSLRSNGIVMEKLLRLRSNNSLQHLIPMYEEDEDLLEDVIIENKQAIEMVEMYGNILSSMMGAFTSIISNNLNVVMKFLASMTILLAIPTMIASFWGMNVHVPLGDGDTNSFWAILFVSFIATGISALVLWKKEMF